MKKILVSCIDITHNGEEVILETVEIFATPHNLAFKLMNLERRLTNSARVSGRLDLRY